MSVEAQRGATLDVAQETATEVLPRRLSHEVERLFARARTVADEGSDSSDDEIVDAGD